MPGNVQVALQVWDIGGQSIFGKMIQTYIYEANAVSIYYIFNNRDICTIKEKIVIKFK